uniref:UMOD/GP2/OIT3-like D8C domain-containing protein n=1 Tax=Sinocyclocheilus anshuiensis TaxID=1608454 RepID=A0A671LKC2_9TELE
MIGNSRYLMSVLVSSLTNIDYDPCNNYNILDNHWRSTLIHWHMFGPGSALDDIPVEWDGWHRLFTNGLSTEMPEWCVSFMSCGGFSGLWLGGSHPRLEDGVVTREMYGSRYDQCSYYRSEPIQVKACPGDYYVYKFTRPTPIFCSVYCLECRVTCLGLYFVCLFFS